MPAILEVIAEVFIFTAKRVADLICLAFLFAQLPAFWRWPWFFTSDVTRSFTWEDGEWRMIALMGFFAMLADILTLPFFFVALCSWRMIYFCGALVYGCRNHEADRFFYRMEIHLIVWYTCGQMCVDLVFIVLLVFCLVPFWKLHKLIGKIYEHTPKPLIMCSRDGQIDSWSNSSHHRRIVWEHLTEAKVFHKIGNFCANLFCALSGLFAIVSVIRAKSYIEDCFAAYETKTDVLPITPLKTLLDQAEKQRNARDQAKQKKTEESRKRQSATQLADSVAAGAVPIAVPSDDGNSKNDDDYNNANTANNNNNNSPVGEGEDVELEDKLSVEYITAEFEDQLFCARRHLWRMHSLKHGFLAWRDLLCVPLALCTIASLYRALLFFSKIFQAVGRWADYNHPVVQVTSISFEAPPAERKGKGIVMKIAGTKAADFALPDNDKATPVMLYIRSTDIFWDEVGRKLGGSVQTFGQMLLPASLNSYVDLSRQLKRGETQVELVFDFKLAQSCSTITSTCSKFDTTNAGEAHVQIELGNSHEQTLCAFGLQLSDLADAVEKRTPLGDKYKEFCSAAKADDVDRSQGQRFCDIFWKVTLMQFMLLMRDVLTLVGFVLLHFFPWRAYATYSTMCMGPARAKAEDAEEEISETLSLLNNGRFVAEVDAFVAQVDTWLRKTVYSELKPRNNNNSGSMSHYRYDPYETNVSTFKSQFQFEAKEYSTLLEKRREKLLGGGASGAPSGVKAASAVLALQECLGLTALDLSQTLERTHGKSVNRHPWWKPALVINGKLVSDTTLSVNTGKKKKTNDNNNINNNNNNKSSNQDGRAGGEDEVMTPAVAAVMAASAADASTLMRINRDPAAAPLEQELHRRAEAVARHAIAELHEARALASVEYSATACCDSTGNDGWDGVVVAVAKQVFEVLYDAAAVLSFFVVCCTVYRLPWMVAELWNAPPGRRRWACVSGMTELALDVVYLLLFLLTVASVRGTLRIITDLITIVPRFPSFRIARAIISYNAGISLNALWFFLTIFFSCRAVKFALATSVFLVMGPGVLLDSALLGMDVDSSGNKCRAAMMLLIGSFLLFGVPFIAAHTGDPSWSASSSTTASSINAPAAVFFGVMAGVIGLALLSAFIFRDPRIFTLRRPVVRFARVSFNNAVAFVLTLFEGLQLLCLSFSALLMSGSASYIRSESLRNLTQYVFLLFGSSWTAGSDSALPFAIYFSVALMFVHFVVVAMPIVCGYLLEWDGARGMNKHPVYVGAIALLTFLTTTICARSVAEMLSCDKGVLSYQYARLSNTSEITALQAAALPVNGTGPICWEGPHRTYSVLLMILATFALPAALTRNAFFDESQYTGIDTVFTQMYRMLTGTGTVAMVVATPLLGSAEAVLIAILVCSVWCLLWTTFYANIVSCVGVDMDSVAMSSQARLNQQLLFEADVSKITSKQKQLEADLSAQSSPDSDKFACCTFPALKNARIAIYLASTICAAMCMYIVKNESPAATADESVTSFDWPVYAGVGCLLGLSLVFVLGTLVHSACCANRPEDETLDALRADLLKLESELFSSNKMHLAWADSRAAWSSSVRGAMRVSQMALAVIKLEESISQLKISTQFMKTRISWYSALQPAIDKSDLVDDIEEVIRSIEGRNRYCFFPEEDDCDWCCDSRGYSRRHRYRWDEEEGDAALLLLGNTKRLLTLVDRALQSLSNATSSDAAAWAAEDAAVTAAEEMEMEKEKAEAEEKKRNNNRGGRVLRNNNKNNSNNNAPDANNDNVQLSNADGNDDDAVLRQVIVESQKTAEEERRRNEAAEEAAMRPSANPNPLVVDASDSQTFSAEDGRQLSF